MERTYREELHIATKNKINILKLNIVNEVVEQLMNGYWWFEGEQEHTDNELDEFVEIVCSAVYNIYLAVDNTYSLPNIVEAVLRLHFECNTDINSITKYMVIGYIQDNF